MTDFPKRTKGKFMEVLTFGKPKYLEQIVAVKNETGLNLRLFDAAELFMDDDTFGARKSVEESGLAKTFAEQFVAQMNLPAALTAELARVTKQRDKCVKALEDIAHGMIPNIPPLDDVLAFRTAMLNWSQERAKTALAQAKG